MDKLNIFKQYKGLPKEIYILFLVRVINSMGAFVFPFLTLFLKLKIGMSEAVVGQYLLVVAMVGIPGSIIAGKLVDKFNRKTIMVTFSMMASAILIVCGFLGNSIIIAYLLVAEVFFMSFAFPASSAMTTDLTTPENRQSCFSFLYLGMNFGMAIGYMMAGYLFENYTQWLFWGDGLTVFASTLLVVFFVKETKPDEAEIKKISESGRKSEKGERGSIFAVLLKRPYLLAFTFIGALTSFVYSQHGFLMPLHMEDLFGVEGTKLFGRVMTLNTIVVVFGTSVCVSLTKRFRPLTNIGIASFTYVIGFGMMFFAKDMTMFYIAAFIWTLGEIIAAVNSGVYVSNHSPVTHRGRFNSILGLIRSTGRSLAPFLMGKYLIGHNYSQGWLLTGFVALVALILLMILSRAENQNKKKKLEKQVA